ncbi:MAG TPA: type I-E CRISPR-associated protein Cas6/Cse3/CasE [Longimicrobiales bacterium]
MPVETATLRLARLHLESRRLVELGRRRRLPFRDMDTGYLVHCALGELFGDAAPKPFSITREQGRAIEVLAYTDREKEALRREADAFADPWLHALCDWDAFDVKALPADWPAGTRLGFKVRVCPVVRMPRGCTTHRPGAEVDAFLARCAAAGKGVKVDRQEVYREWFAAQVERSSGARLLRAGVESFRLGRFSRRTQGEERQMRIKQRPEATIAGELEVTDGAAFDALLRRGIGRHRAFGFGMLLLRRPAR